MSDLASNAYKMMIVEEKTDESSFLDNLLAAIDDEDIKELNISKENPSPKIENRDQAEYYVRRYKELKAESDEINKTADAFIKKQTEKANNWRESELNKRNYLLNYFENILKAYADERRNETGKQSLPLIEGTLAFSKQQPNYDRNEDILRQYLKNIKGGEKYLKPVEPNIDWAAFKKAGVTMNDKFMFNGKEVPGITVTARPDKFVVK